jgi:hypothetical protein
MAKKYIRKSGCLPNKDAQRLLMDIVAYRNATGSKAMYQKRKYSAGYAVFEVVTVPDEEPLENRSAFE